MTISPDSIVTIKYGSDHIDIHPVFTEPKSWSDRSNCELATKLAKSYPCTRAYVGNVSSCDDATWFQIDRHDGPHVPKNEFRLRLCQRILMTGSNRYTALHDGMVIKITYAELLRRIELMAHHR